MQGFFLNAGDIGAGDTALLCHLPLGQGFPAAQPIAQLDHQQFPVRQDLFHGFVEPCGIFPGAEVLKQIVVGADDIHQGEGVAILAGFYVIGQRNVTAGLFLAAKVHQDFIFHTPGGIGGKPCPLGAVKGGNTLDQSDGADGDQILLIGRGRIVFFEGLLQRTNSSR